MKKITFLFSFIAIAFFCRAQVAINTTGSNPNASAMLDISSNNKGLLIPRVSLSSYIDGTTVPAPATSLLVYNTNVGLAKGAGYYFNAGTPATPAWQPLYDLVLPYTKSTSATGSAFTIENYSANASSTAIKAVGGGAGNALEVVGKLKIAGNGQTPAQGKVLTSDANGNATWEGAVAFSAWGAKEGGSEQFANGVEKKIAFATEIYDLSSNYIDAYTSPHSTFTAPVRGIYHFDAQVSWLNSSADGSYEIRLTRVRNGVINRLIISDENDVRWAEPKLSVDLFVEVGDQIYVEGRQVSGGTRDINAGEGTFFNGRLVIKL